MALPIDLNSQLLNRDGKKGADFAPSEMLRLNLGIAPTASPNRLGVLAQDLGGFPNGRRLADDVVDIALQVVAGATPGNLVQALATGDKVDQNDRSFRQSFPYVALPHNVAVNRSGSGGGAAAQPSVAGSAAQVPAGGVGAGEGGPPAAAEGSPCCPSALRSPPGPPPWPGAAAWYDSGRAGGCGSRPPPTRCSAHRGIGRRRSHRGVRGHRRRCGARRPQLLGDGAREHLAAALDINPQFSPARAREARDVLARIGTQA